MLYHPSFQVGTSLVMHSKLSSSSITPHRELRIAHWGKNSNLNQNSHVQNHLTRNSFFQSRIFIKINILKSHFYQNLHFQNLILKKIYSSEANFSQKSHFQNLNFHKNHILDVILLAKKHILDAIF